MNPILANLLLEAEQKGLSLLLDEIAIVVKDVIAGKNIVAAFEDAADSVAEKTAVAAADAMSP
jgi:DNA polymerase III sliding clamp (beta) subunit (PCNA family)